MKRFGIVIIKLSLEPYVCTYTVKHAEQAVHLYNMLLVSEGRGVWLIKNELDGGAIIPVV